MSLNQFPSLNRFLNQFHSIWKNLFWILKQLVWKLEIVWVLDSANQEKWLVSGIQNLPSTIEDLGLSEHEPEFLDRLAMKFSFDPVLIEESPLERRDHPVPKALKIFQNVDQSQLQSTWTQTLRLFQWVLLVVKKDGLIILIQKIGSQLINVLFEKKTALSKSHH